MVQLWEYLLSILEDISEEERIPTLEVITRLMSRRCFDPIYLEGNDYEEIYLGFFQNGVKKGFVCQKYKELFYSTISFTTNKLKLMKEFNEQPEYLSFAASVLAIACFRLPHGTETLLAKICELKSNRKIEIEESDLKDDRRKLSSDFSFDELKTSNEFMIVERERGQSSVITQLQLSRLYRNAKYLSSLKKASQEGHVHDNIQSCGEWVPDARNHSDFFFIFVAEYITQITTILYTDLVIKFKDVPYYKKLIQTYLLLHPTPLNHNSTWFQLSSIILRQNPLLLKKFFFLNFTTTKMFDFSEVLGALDRAEMWSLGLINWPNNFDYSFFTDVIKKLLSLDHFSIVSRTMIFLYNTLDLFYGIERKSFINGIIFKEFFFDLFLHWNADVRMCFHRVLIYKIKRMWKKSVVNIPHTSLNLNEYTSTTRPRSHSQKIEDAVYSAKLQNILLSRESITETLMNYINEDTRNAEELIDIVLKSKLDSYIYLVKSSATHDIHIQEKRKQKSIDFDSTGIEAVEVPYKFRPYINSSLKEFETISVEYAKWKQNVDNSKSPVQFPLLVVRQNRVSG